ncbi:P-loop containing nucleoside triphosphate hydrolase protein [Flagelloscypha sp. PMI_526]|nr:P-loop containing nucleoside triphosphate hydrolase protein [Flagelloscypha sp. PMI_526]
MLSRSSKSQSHTPPSLALTCGTRIPHKYSSHASHRLNPILIFRLSFACTMSTYRRKLVIVGDSNVGKTSLLNRFAHGRDYENYIPTVFESWVADLPVGQDNVELAFWDTSAGHEDYERLRPLSYPHTHVAVIAFSVDSRESFNNVSEKR